jgi:mannosyltransferase OCH1-like enzyme
MEKIPHIIHYCWFGPKKPPRVERFIADWKKKLPDYTFMEWNEENTDISGCAYAREALSAGKYAFVSDYVRVKRLVEYGGVYMDTDVKIIRRFDEFLQGADAVLSMERPGCLSTAFMAAAPGQALFAEFLASYE